MIQTIIKVMATLAIVGLSGATGVWLAMRMARKQGQIPQGELAIRYIRAGLRRNRKARRELLTRGERFVAWTMMLLSIVLVPAGLIILLSGDSNLRFLGIAMLVLALVVAAVPISPILQARVRRRQRTDRSH
jgi:hypothetical protein